MCCLFSNVTDGCGWSFHICIFLFGHWFDDFSAVWCTGSIRGLWSPSGRASCTLSTCRPSHSCRLVGLMLSESSGGPPTAQLLTESSMLQVSGHWTFRDTSVENISLCASAHPCLPFMGQTLNSLCFLTVSLQLQRSLATLCHLMAGTVPSWSVALRLRRSSWQACHHEITVCPDLYLCITKCNVMHVKRIVFLTRPGMGQLGDSSWQPHSRSVCALQLWRKRCPVSVHSQQCPGCWLTGTSHYDLWLTGTNLEDFWEGKIAIQVPY